ncbi:GtrA family protein [Xanthomonas albilineans]|uniref:GtrA family protein n=1 Tax=Xanthomonas albilineans TaxID=29447 RepID=UPI0005F30177|nr:GtrA family protein [Xanthomonas albilineans]PPU94135.1 GtrA family protein [Xanthomonas albilineans]
MISRQFIGFVAVGGIAAAANFSSRILLSHWLAYVPAIALAYLIGMTIAFLLNRSFVFRKSANALHKQAFWFVTVNILAIFQTIAISLLLARWLFPSIGFNFYPETIAHAAGVITPIFTSFIGHKHLSFKIAPPQ